MSAENPLKVYFAGELFSLKHLLGNAALAAEIDRASNGRYQSVLPQDLEQRETTAESIRNQDLKALLECDVGLFNFDGDEIDSGTVLEYAYAKFCDKPSVVVRTDFRATGDQQGDPWNLMLSFYPRTKVIVIDGMALYQKHLAKREAAEPGASVEAGMRAVREIAEQIVDAFDDVVKEPSALREELRESVYHWAREMPGKSFARLLGDDDLRLILDKAQ